MSTTELKEKRIVSTVLNDIAEISCQTLAKEEIISKIMEINFVKRVFAYHCDRRGNTLLGVVISLSGEMAPTRQSHLVVEDITLKIFGN